MLFTTSKKLNNLSELAIHFVALHLSYICIILAFWNPTILFLLFPIFCFERYRFFLLIHLSMLFKYKKLKKELSDTEPYCSNSEIEQQLFEELGKYELVNKIKQFNSFFGVEPQYRTLIKRTKGFIDFTTYDLIIGTSFIILPSNYSTKPAKIIRRFHEHRHLFGHSSLILQLFTYVLFIVLFLVATVIYSISCSNYIFPVLIILFSGLFIWLKFDSFEALKELDADIGTIRVFENFQTINPQIKLESNRTLTQTAAYYLIQERHMKLTNFNDLREWLKKKKTFRYTKYLLPFLSESDYLKITSVFPMLKVIRIPKYKSAKDVYISGDNLWEITAWTLVFALIVYSLIPFVILINFKWYWVFISILFIYASQITKHKIISLCKKTEKISQIGM